MYFSAWWWSTRNETCRIHWWYCYEFFVIDSIIYTNMNMSQCKGINSIKIIKLQSYVKVPIEIIQHCACISLYTAMLQFKYSHCSCYLNLYEIRPTLYMQLPLISQIHKLQCMSTLFFLPFKHLPISQQGLCSSNTHISAQFYIVISNALKIFIWMSHCIKTKQQNKHLWCVLQILKTTDLKTCFYLTVKQLIKFHYVLMKYG
jgi:hypothetical protein